MYVGRLHFSRRCAELCRRSPTILALRDWTPSRSRPIVSCCACKEHPLCHASHPLCQSWACFCLWIRMIFSLAGADFIQNGLGALAPARLVSSPWSVGASKYGLWIVGRAMPFEYHRQAHPAHRGPPKSPARLRNAPPQRGFSVRSCILRTALLTSR